jgi:cobalt-zinc-cadmium efflux system outer membrane protein
MRIYMVVLIIFVLLFSTVSFADDTLIKLKDLEQEALLNNPEILMTAKKAEASDNRKTVASAMPDPMIGYMVQNVGSPFAWSVGDIDMSMQGVVFSQTIPFPGKLGTKGRAAGKEAEQMHESLHATRLSVLNNLRKAYYEYYLAFQSAEILDQTKELMKNFQRIAETRYATGVGIQQDVIRAQLEVSTLLDQIAEQELKKDVEASLINKLTGRDPRAPLGRPAELPTSAMLPSLDKLADMALSEAPVLQEKKLMVDQSKEDLSLSRREFLPDMVISGGVFDRGSKQGIWQASIMFKVPLYFWNKTAGVDAAAASLSAARHEYEAERLDTIARVRDLYSAVMTAEHHLQLYEAGIIPQARLSLESATSNYQVGKIDFLTLVESENTLLKYQLMQQGEIVTLNKTLSMLHEITGEEHE